VWAPAGRERATPGEANLQPLSNRSVDEYLLTLYDGGEDAVPRQMEALADERDFPIVGPLVGRHLEQLTRMIGARRVFELGSGFGYSALYFARAVGPGGEVHCTDLSEDNRQLAEEFLDRAGLWERVTYHVDEATRALATTGGIWDVIYNDIDKVGYPETVALAYAHLRPGGLFITDNLLWSGRVFEKSRDATESTRAIRRFTQLLFAHPGFSTTLYPVRDGVAVALKLPQLSRQPV
jgi:predicted O-methyltransferase YrrM